MLSVSEILEILKFGGKYGPKVVNWFKSKKERPSWENYYKLFDVDGYKIPYINLINDWKNDFKEYDSSNFIVGTLDVKFAPPDSITNAKIPEGAFDGKSCRLAHFNIASDDQLVFTFQETSYYDYLKSGEYLDSPHPANTLITNREAFGNKIKEHRDEIFPFEFLTNICGTGVFIITKDNYFLISKHSEESHVYPGRYSFSSSGIMEWGRDPNQYCSARYLREGVNN